MIFGLCAVPICSANEKSVDKNKTPEIPEMAFLEFLAEMQEVDGKLLDPTDMLEMAPAANAILPEAKGAGSQKEILQLFNSELPAEQSPKNKQIQKNKATNEEEKQ